MAFTKIEVGGNFNLTYSQLHAECSETEKRISGIFKEWKYYTLTSSGREALLLLLENWQPENKTVLLPEYLCYTEIEPFKKKGYKIIFYRINNDLTPAMASVESVVNENPGAFLYVQSYFGKDTLKFIRAEFKKYRKEYRIIIIEDRTQIWLSSTPLDGADFYVTSLRKWLELPDGGLLSSQMHNVSSFEKNVEEKKLSELFSRASLLKEQFYHTEEESLKTTFRHLYYQMNDVFTASDKPHEIGSLSRKILAMTDLEDISSKRRKNYAILAEGLKEITCAVSVLADLDKGEVPLYYPIYVKGRADFQHYMCSNRVYCPIIWPRPADVDEWLCHCPNNIYDNILCIPCDQRYNKDDMITIISLIRRYGI